MDDIEAASAIGALVKQRREEMGLNRTAFAVRAGIDESELDSLDLTQDWAPIKATLQRLEVALDWKPGSFARLWENRAGGISGDGLRIERADAFGDLFGGLFGGQAPAHPERRVANASDFSDAELVAELARRLQQAQR